MNTSKSLISLIIIVVLLIMATTAYAQTIVVMGDTSAGENQPGWLFNRDASTSTPYEFNFDQASIGTGSLYVLPIGANAADKFIGENFINEPIANVNSISYDFYIGSGGSASDENEFYMNVYANFGESDDFKFYDCRYDIVPTVGSTSAWTTVTFDPTQSYPVTTRTGGSASPYTCPSVPADMDNLSAGSNIRMFAISVGDTSANDVGLDGYYDNVVVNLDSGTTTYDFEPAPACDGLTPTIYVDNGVIVGGPKNGQAYTGKLVGTGGPDVIFATDGNDTVVARGGHDTICTLAGDDLIKAGGGNDWINAGANADLVQAQGGNDTIDCGSDGSTGRFPTDMGHGGGGSDTAVNCAITRAVP